MVVVVVVGAGGQASSLSHLLSAHILLLDDIKLLVAFELL